MLSCPAPLLPSARSYTTYVHKGLIQTERRTTNRLGTGKRKPTRQQVSFLFRIRDARSGANNRPLGRSGRSSRSRAPLLLPGTRPFALLLLVIGCPSVTICLLGTVVPASPVGLPPGTPLRCGRPAGVLNRCLDPRFVHKLDARLWRLGQPHMPRREDANVRVG